ncbi:class I SAM-dependent methyltransferase [Nocardia sp. NPDC050697]|uniref:class I SAM-dependent methyltransferase n=1 Tax=Nocardia sp. NPDC050697 TaxID=3155158 RepID=UPI0033D8BDCB
MSGSPLETAEVWDAVAVGYGEFAAAVMRPFAVLALEFAALTSESAVLDVAAGTGALSLPAAERAGRVAAVDISPGMLRLLADAAAAAGLHNIVTDVADARELPYADRSFDAAFSMFGLMFFPDRYRALGELHRVLRPGGTVVISNWAPVCESPLLTMLYEAFAEAVPELGEPQQDFLSLENPEVFQSELRTAGFHGVVIQRHSIVTRFADGAELWETMVRSSAALQLMRTLWGEELWAERSRRVREYLDRRYRPNQPLPAIALLGIGHKPQLD